MAIQNFRENVCLRNLWDVNNAEKMKLIKQLNESGMGKQEDPDKWITNLERLKQLIAECRKTIDDNVLVMHILYHLPTEYDTINDKYLKDLDDRKDVDLEDLRADLRRKHDRLVALGCIEKNNEDGNDKLVKEERALKKGFKNNLKENVVCAVKLVTKEQIVGRWIVIKKKDLPDTTTKMTATEIISSMAIVTIVTKRAIKKLIAGQNSGTMPTT